MSDPEPLLTFESWYSESWPGLVASLSIALRDQEAGEEAAAHACAMALARWPDVRMMRSPAGWAFVVGMNFSRRRFRTARREQDALRKSREIRTNSDFDLVDFMDSLQALSKRQRQVLALRYGLDMTQDEIAATLGIAPGTAAALLNQSRRAWMNVSERHEPDVSITKLRGATNG